MRKIVFRHQGSRSTLEQRPTYRMSVSIVFIANLFQWLLEQIPDDYSLTYVKIAKRIKMYSAWLAEILMGAGIETFPGQANRPINQHFRGPCRDT